MGTALTGLQIGSTYNGLLKTTDNAAVSGTLRTITDGLGNDTALQVSSAGVKSTGTLESTGAFSAADLATITKAAGASTVVRLAALTRTGDAADNGQEIAFLQTGVGNALSYIRTIRQASAAKDKLSFGVSANWGTTAPTEYMALDSTGLAVTGDISVSTKTPASASATGVAGTITWDANYIYVCTATNTWKRVAISTW